MMTYDSSETKPQNEATKSVWEPLFRSSVEFLKTQTPDVRSQLVMNVVSSPEVGEDMKRAMVEALATISKNDTTWKKIHLCQAMKHCDTVRLTCSKWIQQGRRLLISATTAKLATLIRNTHCNDIQSDPQLSRKPIYEDIDCLARRVMALEKKLNSTMRKETNSR